MDTLENFFHSLKSVCTWKSYIHVWAGRAQSAHFDLKTSRVSRDIFPPFNLGVQIYSKPAPQKVHKMCQIVDKTSINFWFFILDVNQNWIRILPWTNDATVAEGWSKIHMAILHIVRFPDSLLKNLSSLTN